MTHVNSISQPSYPAQFVYEKVVTHKILVGALAALTLLSITYAFYRYWIKTRIVTHDTLSQPIVPFPTLTPAGVIEEIETLTPPPSNQIVIEHEGRTIVLPQDVLGEIARHADFPLSLSNVCKGFLNTYENTFFTSLFHSCRRSPFLEKRMLRIIENNPSASHRIKVLEYYKDLIQEIDIHEDGEVIKENTFAAYGRALDVGRFDELESGLNDIHLIHMFQGIVYQVPQARAFLNGMGVKDTASKAQDIREWMNVHPNELSTLTQLDLSNKDLTQLPKEIHLLVQLQKLNISHNQITIWPEAISQLANLRHLDISSNKLTALSAGINHLANLRTLRVGFNKIQNLPIEIGQLAHLEALDLIQNKLKNLPMEICRLDQLRYLLLGSTTPIALPAELNRIIRLKILLPDLYLNYNQNILNDSPNCNIEFKTIGTMYSLWDRAVRSSDRR
jgi:hypothetical protein